MQENQWVSENRIDKSKFVIVIISRNCYKFYLARLCSFTCTSFTDPQSLSYSSLEITIALKSIWLTKLNDSFYPLCNRSALPVASQLHGEIFGKCAK